ncbi:hypothetical protein PV325_008549 [Microctonus aethiopoides]|uniref:TPX2 C-terminal domain-containing protein n=1 Tax=Microctonus aethiopoides TaxID=144406 RepID=A0AA39KQN3_9HYME|nr:hypothetical protein PV325_008549 [Microctonus aethiopoides]KAK0095177.1 hypothetical protein PV326_009044 [Microctonus aethiopoides]KAK0169991.1 hypothetical protein PV328_010610 [Microctonus aethiopoides]
MDIRTSTPFVVPKIRTYRENDYAKNDKPVNDEWYNALNAPNKFDFNHEISDQHESYFDNETDDTKSLAYGPLVSRIANDTESIVRCLKNCSISGIDELSIEDSTLKVAGASIDNTLTNDTVANIKTPDNTAFKNESMERRKSTVVKPFSFEIREKLKSEHKLERLQYYQKLNNEQLNASGFELKSAALHQNVNNIPHAQTKKQVGKTNIEQAQKNKIQPWKRKPFQVKLAKLPLTIPISPKLSTAERARSRKLTEEKLMEKERLEIERKKKILAAQNQRGKVGNAAYRKHTDFKTVPHHINPSAIPKRPACDPMFPQITKRRRRI